MSGFLQHRHPGMIMLVDVDAGYDKQISTAFWGPSNRIHGWLVPKGEVERHLADFQEHREVGQQYELVIWSYNDEEYAGTWLFSDKGAVFGERRI